MNKQEIDNLKLIIEEKYAHICIYPSDLSIFLNVPSVNKNYYECINKAARIIGKRGFMNGGKTTIWTDWLCLPGHVKIATNQPYVMTADTSPTYTYLGPNTLTKGWSEPMSYQHEGSFIKIQKLMKLKAFW